MKSFLASLVIMVLVLMLVFVNYAYLAESVDRLSELEKSISHKEGDYREEKNKSVIKESLDVFQKDHFLFCLSYKKSLFDHPKNSLDKLLILIGDENYSDYLLELQEYSFHLKKLKNESRLNWHFVF